MLPPPINPIVLLLINLPKVIACREVFDLDHDNTLHLLPKPRSETLSDRLTQMRVNLYLS